MATTTANVFWADDSIRLLSQPIPVTNELFAGMKTSSFSIPGTGAGLASLLGTSTPWGAGIGAGIGLLGSLF